MQNYSQIQLHPKRMGTYPTRARQNKCVIGHRNIIFAAAAKLLAAIVVLAGHGLTAESQDWATATAANNHTVAVKTDGTLWAWGSNQYGKLGDGTKTNRNSPVQVGSSKDWKAVTAYDEYTVAIKKDGTLWAWGRNQHGQLGNGTKTDSSVPIQVGSAKNWAAVSTGGYHTVAIKTDGTLWAWGYNQSGQLGDGKFVPRDDDNDILAILTRPILSSSEPIQVGSDKDWAAISAGRTYTMAIKTNGTLWAWGDNEYGQLGDDSKISRGKPVQVGSDKNWKAVSAGGGHTVALKTDGTLWAWGSNYNYGGRDDNPRSPHGSQYKPFQVGSDKDWAAISDGTHTVAIKTNGTLWAWGGNKYGQLGDGSGTNKSQPTQVGSAKNWKAASASGGHTVAIRTDGTAWAWGRNNYGQLGDGTIENKSVPIQVGAGSSDSNK